MGSSSRLTPLERDAQATIVELARTLGWAVYHTHDSRRSRGGFPDLTLWRDRIVFAELKKQGERPRRDQVQTLSELARAGAEVYVWTLDDLHEVGRVLQRHWAFVPHGRTVRVGGSDLTGPRLVEAGESFAPRSIWILGHGRRGA